MKNNKKKTTTLVILLIVIACLTIGYALLSTVLNINGNAILSGNTWDIHWANVQVNSESTQGNTQEAVITSPTQVEFGISLDKPGDYYEFTVDAVNEGTIDGMIDVISTNVYQSNGTTPTTLPSAITYSVTYEDDVELARYQLLSANSSEKYKVRVEYKKDISASELIANNQSYVIKVGVTYKQADGNAITRPTPGVLPNYNESGGCATINTDSSGGGGNATMSGLTLKMKTATNGEDDPSWFTNSAANQSQLGVYTRKGTSNDKYPIYYYRGSGSLLNNNLLFNGYCWKIVRTTATGGVRIIYNGLPSNGQCRASIDDTTQLPQAKFNTSTNNAKYVKYVYDNNGTPTDSNIKTVLENWYNTNMRNVDDKIEKSVYCNDTSELTTQEKSALSLNTSHIYYCSEKRTMSGTPTTLCSKKSDAYREKVGFLTVDEVMLAGRTFNYGMQDYLFNNHTYWLGSPCFFNGSYSVVFQVVSGGYLDNISSVIYNAGIRPVITLKANTSYTGTGTAISPFVVS